MFVRWQRRRLRGQFTLLLNGELSASQEARLRRCLATDPLLARELECFQRLLAELGQLPLASAPRALAAELQIELDFVTQPLREHYADLLDGSLPPGEAATLRAAIAAEPHLVAELELLEAALTCLRALPAEPVPASFRPALSGRLEDAAPPYPSLVPGRLPRLAWATALLLFALGAGLMIAGRQDSSPAGSGVVATNPTPEAAPAVSAPVLAPAEPPAVPVVAKPVVRPAAIPRPAAAPPAPDRAPAPRRVVRVRPAAPAAREVAARRAAPDRQSRPVAVAASGRRETASVNRLRTMAAFTTTDRIGASKPLAISRSLLVPAEDDRSREIPEPAVLNAVESPRLELEFTAGPDPD